MWIIKKKNMKCICFGLILVLVPGSAPSVRDGETVPAVLRSPTPLHWLRLLLTGGHAGPRAGPLHPVHQDGLRCQLQTARPAGASVQTSVSQNRICEAWGHQTLSLLVLSFRTKDWATTVWTQLRWVWESLLGLGGWGSIELQNSSIYFTMHKVP